MSNRALIKINGVALPIPSEYKVSFSDLDSDQWKRYVTTGVMRRKRIRGNLLKVSIMYNLSEMVDTMAILDAISPETYTAELYLPNEGIRKTLTMYSNNKGFNYIRAGGELKAQSLTFDLTEV